MLNKALRAGEMAMVYLAIHKAVHTQNDLTQFALRAGVSRTNLYRAFGSDRRYHSKRGPRLDTAMKVLRALSLRFVVQVARQNLNSCTRETSDRLTRAFKAGETSRITGVLYDTLRVQENVSELAKKTSVGRSALYHAFQDTRRPRLSTVLSFLNVLGLRLEVKPLPVKRFPFGGKPERPVTS
jgi:DNA-binding phage protein